jgi:hypothetical protein
MPTRRHFLTLMHDVSTGAIRWLLTGAVEA